MWHLMLREIRRGLRAAIIWSLCMGGMVFLMMYLFPSIAKAHKQWDTLISQLPKGLLSGFGMDKLQLSNIFGYYGTQAYPFILLFAGMYVGMLTSGLLAREETERTIEFLLAKPITRNEVVTGKLTGALALILFFNVVLFLVTWVSFALFHTDPYRFHTLLLLGVGNLLVTVLFAAFGFVLSVFGKRPRNLAAVSIGIVFVTYLMSVVAEVSKQLHVLRFFTPFEYVSATHIVLDHRITWGALSFFGILSVVFVAMTYIAYSRRDISG